MTRLFWTHVPWDFGALQDLRDITGGNKTIKTACNRRILYVAGSLVTTDPDCPACKAALAEHERMAQVLAGVTS